MTSIRATKSPAHNLPVYRGSCFAVTSGANLGDAISFAEELVLDDVYCLDADADLSRIALQSAGGQFCVSAPTELGVPGAPVCLDSALTFMSFDGRTHEALLLVELDPFGHVRDSFLLPLTPLAAKTDYTLVGIDQNSARAKMAQVASVSFTRGTKITTDSGKQVPIEQLQVGDKVLTRDAGVQRIRWIGETTLRAVGELAPIRITAGTMNNLGDLIVSPEHRLFIYQRTDRIGAGRSDILVKARHLVNDDTITVMQGGFVDYFQLLFDTHQIIYAEGIAAESFLIDTRTAPAVPEEVSKRLAKRAANTDRDLSELDVNEALLNRPDAAEVLKRASIH